MRRLTVLLLGVVMAALSFATLPEVPNAEAHSLYDVRLVAQNSGKCLDIVGENPNPLTKTHQWACGGWPEYPGGVVPWQQWDIVPYDGTWHFIKNRFSQLCLDVYGGTSEDVQLHQWTCNYTDAQKFTAPSCVGCWAEMRNKASNKCVDVYGAGVGDGVIILQTTCNGTRAQQWAPDNHSPEKRLLTDRWYQRVEDSGSYVTWMTLTGHRHYASSGFSGTWATPISNALSGWNDPNIAPNTVYITDQAPADWHDVHIAVTNNCFTDFGVTRCTNGALGVVYIFDELKHECVAGDCDALHSRPNTWWYVQVLLDNNAHTPPYNTAWSRQATASHELGHAVGLRHDNSRSDGEAMDGDCGNYLRQTIMDYDCVLDLNDPNRVNLPQFWDSCGINHAYYDPGVGWAGC